MCATLAFWEAESDGIRTETTTRAEIRARCWHVVATRPLKDVAWIACYDPLLARCDNLEAAGTGSSVPTAIAAAREEASDWRAVAQETGYMPYVVRPA